MIKAVKRMSSFDQYLEAVRYLESITNIKQPDYMTTKRGRLLFLKRFEYLLRQLGNPHKKLRYIHVGGSSGKGSVATMIHSILTAAGYTVGLYTSPYTTTPAEKFKINDKLISAKEFSDIITQLKPVVDLMHSRSPYGRPSWFEISTAVALLYFVQKKCDYAVLEVGLGGRFDATNLIPAPVATVINTIDLDHTELLGNTVEKIAKEKAGIIKPGTTFFTTSANKKSVLAIFEKICKKHGVSSNVILPPSTVYSLKLAGKHQQHNATIAAAVARHLGIAEKIIRRGLFATTLPCRLEMIQKKPQLILDGAHNRSKLKTTAAVVEHLTYHKLYLIIALTYERSAAQIFKPLVAQADYLYLTRYLSTHRHCFPPRELAKKISTKKPKKIFLDPYQALEAALEKATASDLIVVTGSLFLAGELRKRWRSEKQIVTQRKS